MTFANPRFVTVYGAVRNFFGPRYSAVVAPYMELVEDWMQRGEIDALQALEEILAEVDDFSEAKRSLVTAAAIEVSRRGCPKSSAACRARRL